MQIDQIHVGNRFSIKKFYMEIIYVNSAAIGTVGYVPVSLWMKIRFTSILSDYANFKIMYNKR